MIDLWIGVWPVFNVDSMELGQFGMTCTLSFIPAFSFIFAAIRSIIIANYLLTAIVHVCNYTCMLIGINLIFNGGGGGGGDDVGGIRSCLMNPL